MARAESTPLVLGARGSAFDLALMATWFQGQGTGMTAVADWERVRARGLGRALPMNLETTAQRWPLVATSLEYLEWRALELEAGRLFVQVGECVVGSEVARGRGLSPGDRLLTDVDASLSLAAPYPLELEVVGVLRTTGSPDDRAVFTDLKTAWIAQGIGHGHDDVLETSQENVIFERTADAVVANANLRQHMRLTRENLASFHFHGDPSTFPLSAVILVPEDARGEALWLGMMISPSSPLQIVRPQDVMERVLGSILRVQALFDFAFLLLMGVTGILLTLVVFLTLKVRKEEMVTFAQLGAPRRLLVMVQCVEYAVPAALGGLAAWVASPLVVRAASDWIEILLIWRGT
jgi:putative ABC transport system permease protein